MPENLTLLFMGDALIIMIHDIIILYIKHIVYRMEYSSVEYIWRNL